MKISTQLIIGGVLPIAVVLVIVLAVHTDKLQNMSDDWVARVKADMVQSETDTLSVRTGSQANLSRLLLGKSLNNIGLLTFMSFYLQSIGFKFNYELYYNVPPLGIPPGPLTTSSKDARPHNSLNSGWFRKGITNAVERDTYEASVANISNLDNVYYPMYESNKDYLNVYFGVESSGHYQTEPWTETNFHTATYIAYPSGLPTQGYDPRIRRWYYDSFSNKSKTILTDPYNDALTGEVLITMAKYVSPDSFPGEGVHGIDIYLTELSEAVAGSTILQNGEFYVVSLDGNAVLYKNIDLNNVRQFVDIIFQNQGDKTNFDPVWQEIISNDKVSTTFTRNGQLWHIVTDKVLPTDLANNGGFFKDLENAENISIPFIIVAVVPQSDIEAAANDVEDKAQENIDTSLAINIVVTVIFVLVAVVFFWYLSRRVSAPLIKFSRLANNLASGNLDCNVEGVDDISDLDSSQFKTSADMSSLSAAIQKLYMFLRAGNLSYWKADFRAALQNYDDVEKAAGSNKKIKGSIENNRGAAYQGLKDFENADKHYSAAIENAEELLAEENALTGDDRNPEKIKHYEKVLRNRKFNQAALGVDIMAKNPGNDAIKAQVFKNINDVITDYNSVEDMVGLAKANGILGRYYSVIGDHQNAYNSYVNAHKAIYEFSQQNPDKFETQRLSLDYATYNLAEFFANEAQRTGNTGYYNNALQFCNEFRDRNVSKQIPQRILLNFLSLQLMIAEKIGRTDIIDGLQGAISRVPGLSEAVGGGSTSSGPKLHNLSIDISGSMMGGRMDAVAGCLAALYNEVFHPDDKVCVSSFNHNVNPLTRNEYWPKANVGAIMTRSGNGWNPGNRTAFFEAVHRALSQVHLTQQRDASSPIVNVFILTDGTDTIGIDRIRDVHGRTMTKAAAFNDIERMIKQCRINLIFFTIDNEYDATQIQRWTDAAKTTPGCFGIHLKAGADVNSIKEKFKVVQKIMGGTELNVETFA